MTSHPPPNPSLVAHGFAGVDIGCASRSVRVLVLSIRSLSPSRLQRVDTRSALVVVVPTNSRDQCVGAPKRLRHPFLHIPPSPPQFLHARTTQQQQQQQRGGGGGGGGGGGNGDGSGGRRQSEYHLNYRYHHEHVELTRHPKLPYADAAALACCLVLVWPCDRFVRTLGALSLPYISVGSGPPPPAPRSIRTPVLRSFPPPSSALVPPTLPPP